MTNQTGNLYGQSPLYGQFPVMANPGYQTLSSNYDALTADANATRDRNMARIEQYGNSQRSDLNIKNQQALAAARQSAIRRGLGNTTIQDSLVRGQNFDNNRQMMSLEDQLLQNRISTDSDLSKNYQSALQHRAQGMSNLYTQLQQMQNANEQAALNRQASFAQQAPYSMTMQRAPVSSNYGSGYQPVIRGGFVGGNNSGGFVGSRR